MGKRQISQAEFQIVYIATHLLREGKYNSSLLRCGLHVVISFQAEYENGVGKEYGNAVEKPDKNYLSQVIKVISLVINPVDSVFS